MERRFTRRELLTGAKNVGIGLLLSHGIRLYREDPTAENHVCNIVNTMYQNLPQDLQTELDNQFDDTFETDFRETYCNAAPTLEISVGVTQATGINTFRILGFVWQSMHNYVLRISGTDDDTVSSNS